MRKTKIVCTIGPATSEYETLKKLAASGMNVARLNMSHGDFTWHGKVINAIKRINERTNFSVAIMLDTKGPEIRTGDLKNTLTIKTGDEFIFTTRNLKEYPENTVSISYDSFHKDVSKGDRILIDGGMLVFKVIGKKGRDVVTQCIDGGGLTSRRHVNIRGKSANLPSITKKDWEDIEFGITNGIDFIALSFVKNKNSVVELREYLEKKNSHVKVISKIESAEASENIEEIVAHSDGVMVARGDLGSELPVEEVPVIQDEIIITCRKYSKPVIVATQLLESMMVNPTPTRAEVSDIAGAVRAKSDAIMLSGETAVGKYPIKCVEVMDKVAKRIEKGIKREFYIPEEDPKSDTEIVRSAAQISNNLKVKGILVFTRRGYMASLLAGARPSAPIFAFTNTSYVRRRLNIYWNTFSHRIDFSKDPEKTIDRAFEVLKENENLEEGDRIIVLSDILVKDEFVQTIQYREV